MSIDIAFTDKSIQYDLLMSAPDGRKERTLPVDSRSSGDPEVGDDSTSNVRALPPLDGGSADAHSDVISESDVEGQSEPEAAERSTKRSEIDSKPAAKHGHAVVYFGVKMLAWLALSPLLFIVPFVVVLRVAVIDYRENSFGGWESIGIGAVAALLVICAFIAAFMWTFRIKPRFFMHFFNVVLATLLCYSGYALFHLDAANAKSEEVRGYYTSLHPLLRVAVKNLVLVDQELVVTDVHRTPAEYEAMGLPVSESSLHFRQSTGFVHAVDLRTEGRSRFENLVIELYFLFMGFETLRHVGTADHLHVSLPLNESGDP